MNRTQSQSSSRLAAQFTLLAAVALLFLLVSPSVLLAEPGPRFFGVLKGEQLVQTNAGPAVADGPSNLVFQAFHDLGEEAGFLLLAPGNVEVPMNTSEDPSGREYRRSYSSMGAMDASFPNGSYTMVVPASTGPRTNALLLTGDLYPGAAVLNNFTVAQAIDPATSFTVGWDPIAGGTTNDLIHVEIVDCQGGRIFESVSPGAPGALDGTSTSLQIPARRLRPGQRYGIELMTVRFSTYDTNSQPDAVGVAGYFRRTRSWLTTSGAPTGCPMGRFELLFQYPFFQLGASTQGVVSFPQTLGFYVANYSVEGHQDTNFPAQVRFTGPGGFGWSNETNHSGHLDPFFAWYGARWVDVPPFPPGGLYTVDYKGSNQVFNLLDPNAAHQQTLLVPTAVVDPTGLLTELRWVYHATNGSVVGPPPYMNAIVIRVEGAGGNFYDPMHHGTEIRPSDSAHRLLLPFPWSGVRQITIGFRDSAGHQFVSHWNRAPDGGPQILTGELPPGAVGAPYQFVLSGQGAAPLRWTLDGGALPQNLHLHPDTGEIGGTPSSPGEFPLDLRLTDAQSNSVVRHLMLFIEGGGGPEVGSEPNLRELLLLKGLEFVQTNAAGATPAGPSNVIFRASVAMAGPSSVTNGALSLPNGTHVPFVPPGESGDDEAFVEGHFNSMAAMDAAFPNGRYDFVLATANDGPLTNSVMITGNLYPATPRISNLGAAQSVNPTNDFTLTWDELAGATTNELVLLEVRDCRDREVFGTPGPGEPGALNGVATSVLIPARTLRPGRVYSANLIVARIVTDEPTVPATGRRRAAYLKQLSFKLTTQGPPEECGLGDLRLAFTFRAGVFNGTAGFSAFPQDVAFYTAHFSIEHSAHLPENVLFSGPPGSGLNHSPAAHRGSDDQRAWFSSVNVSTPPYPPGGVYAVQFDDVTHPHTVLNPNVADQKILLVPNVETNATGGVTAIHWTYRDAAGAIVSPVPAFVRQLRLRLDGSTGPLFFLGGGFGEGPVPPATNVVVDPPVPWNSVIGLQTGFSDSAGNEFLADWFRGSSAIQITTFALPGGVLSNSYQGFLTAFGGTPPLTWSITTGQLPSGLTLNPETGMISGLPLENGSFPFSARVVDANENGTERGFVIWVKPPGPDVATYLVAKGRRFQQTNAAPPGPAEPGFQFVSFVDAHAPGNIQNASLQLPGGLARTLNQDFDRFVLEELFETQSALDAAFANGVYTFSIVTAHEGSATPSLLLTNNAYPAAPRIANWPAAQNIAAGQGFARGIL